MTQISNRALSFLAAFILLALIAQASAELFWRFFMPENEVTSSPTTETSQNQTQPLTLNQLPLNLFETPKQTPSISQPKIDSTQLRRTRLNLTLIGVLEQGSNSVAILKRPGKDDTAYKIGETIQTGVTLSAVHSTWVVLDNNGQAEKLVLPGIKEGAQLTSPVRSTTATSDTPNLTAAQQRKLDHYKKLIKQNPMNLMKAVQVKPLYQNGGLKGFQVMPGTERSIFKALGFQSRDIITEVNGVKFNSMAVAMQKGPALINAEQFQIKLIRNNQPTELTVNLAP